MLMLAILADVAIGLTYKRLGDLENEKELELRKAMLQQACCQ